ncbi:MAG: UDP-3-O-acylglucosamine N-acyltransferase [candidate division BRC1 bacterium ADurb.BinA292]|nr:MAG: UDP-3-O-acylglucosamine N-acyltransferase [candidate division BRC1 bacterium ADurb.BinA292]
MAEGELAPVRLTGLATLAEAQTGEISFVAGEKLAREAQASRAGLLITSPRLDFPGRARLVVDQVWEAVARLLERLYPPPRPAAGVHPTAVLGAGVEIGPGATVGPYCVLGDGCRIGEDAVLGPHCVLDAGCRVGRSSRLGARVTLAGPVEIGERVTIHPGAVLGADGFKFELVGGRPLKIPQVGTVIIEDDVEIGANTTIDRAFLNETRIGRGTKIDNQVQVAHNCQIGPGCILAAQVGIAGSTRLGAGCLLGGGAGLADGLTIGNGVMIGAQSGVHSDWADGEVIQGAPAMPARSYWRVMAMQARLPEYVKRLRAVEQRLGEGKHEES